MGLSPKWLENCDEDVLQVYQDAEDAILANMAERIAAFDCYIPAAEHQRQVLLEMGATQEYILKELSRRTGIAKEKLKQLMQEAGIEAAQSDAEIHRANGKPVPDQASDVMQSILQAGYEQTAGAFDNITRTTALTGTNQLYRELNTAWLTVSSGAMSYDQAVRAAIKSLAASGLDAAVYPSGRTMSIDSVVRMAVRTGVNQTAAHVQIQLAEELGADLVEVTAHAGARPSHAAWQGKVYSLTGQTPGYETLEAATGYGTVSGLCGANCRHNFFPYYEGDARAHTQDELQEYTKPDAVTYNGKGYSLYEAQQIQRAHERQIRKWKRERDMLKTVGKDNSEAVAKLRYWQERQSDFLEQTGLRRQASREWVVNATGIPIKSQTYGKVPKYVAKHGENGIIKTRKIDTNETVSNPMNAAQYERMKKKLEARGCTVIAAKGDDERFLRVFGAEAISDEHGIMHLGEIPSASAFFEEIIHFTQMKKYGVIDSDDYIERAAREIAANRMLLKNGKAYGFTEEDFQDISTNLKYWEEDFKRKAGISYDESERKREI